MTIDLALAGVEPDGTTVYDSPWNALGAQVQRGIIELILEYPQQTLDAADFCLRVAGLVALGGFIFHFASEPQKKPRQGDRKSLSVPTRVKKQGR